MSQSPEYIEHIGFVAEVIRTHRTRSASIKIDEGALTVVVPCELPIERIQKLISDKKRWIKEKLYLQQQARPTSTREFVSGESLPYLGRNYRLKVKNGHYQPAKLVQGCLVVTIPEDVDGPDIVRNAVLRWYRAHALGRFQSKAKRWASVLGVEPRSISIKAFKSRWGSCSAEGNIVLNWRVIMAPNRIVDYVVAHELCHLRHYDHSAQFWKALGKVIPDYIECKEWLKANGVDLVM